jgi:hypothetical protein
MQWQSRDVETAHRQSQQVLLYAVGQAEGQRGFFGKLFLLPSAYSARKNDNGETLQQVLAGARCMRAGRC